MQQNDPNQPPSRTPQRRQSRGYGPAPVSGGYGGGYGGYGADYGYGGYGGGAFPDPTGHAVQRTLQDYLLILRERIWYIIAAFVLVVAGAAVYTFTATKTYRAQSMVQIFRSAPKVMQMQQVVDSDIRSAEDLNTQVNLLRSSTIASRVAARLEGADREQFLAPYRDPETGAVPEVPAVVERNRTIVPQRISLNVALQYQHPDPVVAAKVADLFADEYISYNTSLRTADTLQAVKDLEKRASDQRESVNRLAKGLQEYRARNNLVSLDEKKDIATDALKALNSRVTQATAALQEAETRLQQVRGTQDRGEDLLKLPFIAAVPAVSELQKDVATRRIAVNELSQTLRAAHPQMIAANTALGEAERQLALAIATAVAQVEANQRSAAQNLAQARESLEASEKGSFALEAANVEYENLVREYDVANTGLQGTLKRMLETETSAGSNFETLNARLVDRAKIPGAPISPNVRLNLALGMFGGLILGVGLAFFISYIDDRAKSAYDIEAVIGLPLLAIVPKFKNADSADPKGKAGFKALKEPEIAEAFSTLYSSLRLKDESRTAKCIVVTSTVPGEGKSFISRNLAMTFASHGERVLLIDCDLRRPVAHRPFQVENVKGVIDVCDADGPVTAALVDSVILKNVQPGLDLMPSGGRSKNPAQMLTSHNFELLLAELRNRYDRIFIDTPPVALVSDALVILPLADGSIYSIFFNKVRRKAAQFCVRRILEINIPTFGAVLNGLDRDIGGYYYHHYYDKKYKNYYAAADGDADARGGNRQPDREAK